jgi:hypothetical protein
MLRPLFSVMLMSFFAAQYASAADLAPPPSSEPVLHGDATIYGWGPMFSGELGVDGIGPVDIPEGSGSIENILKDLEGFFMGNASLRYGAWGVFGDVVWADLGQGKTSASGFARAESSLSGLVGTAALTYALVDTPDVHLDALAGARLWSVDAGIKLSVAGGAWDVNEKDNISWVDPLIGLRGRLSLSPDFFLGGAGAIGGFGIGSDFMWDVAATISVTASRLRLATARSEWTTRTMAMSSTSWPKDRCSD